VREVAPFDLLARRGRYLVLLALTRSGQGGDPRRTYGGGQESGWFASKLGCARMYFS
jgi:hypothetical protein